jgi:hypothetical protein
VFDRFDTAAIDAGVPEDLKTLWSHAEAAWDEQARHALFVERAIASGFAAYAASRYRARGTGDPVAVEQLGRMTSRLEQAMALSSTAARKDAGAPPRTKAALYLLAILLFLVVGALGLAMVLR